MYYIIRNNQQYGPYSPSALKAYVEEGKILRSDIAFEQNRPSERNTVVFFLKREGIYATIKQNGGIVAQLKDIGGELIFPRELLSRAEWFKDKRLLMLALIGLLPAFLIRFTFVPFITFYAIALYFSIIWALFFFYLFKTSQVESRTTVMLFFVLQAIVFVLWDILMLPKWPIVNLLYSFTASESFIIRVVGYVGGVGFFEESVKALPLVWLLFRSKEPILPQTLLFYGLISGIAFGVFEGVQYQLSVNVTLDYSNAFFMNIARLTSLPFLHAIWAGIAGYFLAFANLFPKYRASLYLLAIAIPATIHGLYDTLGWSIPGLLLTLLSVALLMTYLRKGVNYQSKLSH